MTRKNSVHLWKVNGGPLLFCLWLRIGCPGVQPLLVVFELSSAACASACSSQHSFTQAPFWLEERGRQETKVSLLHSCKCCIAAEPASPRSAACLSYNLTSHPGTQPTSSALMDLKSAQLQIAVVAKVEEEEEEDAKVDDCANAACKTLCAGKEKSSSQKLACKVGGSFQLVREDQEAVPCCGDGKPLCSCPHTLSQSALKFTVSVFRSKL